MNKKMLIIALALVILVLIGGAYYYWKIKPQQTAENIEKIKAEVSADISNNVSPDVTTPTVNLPSTNANPYDKTNPFTDLKTNPFQ